MRPWQGWLGISVIGAIGGLLLWFGLAIVVRVEQSNAQIDVTVERRFLGLLSLSTERVHDVVKADVYVVWNRGSTSPRQGRGSTIALELTRRDGGIVRWNRFGPSMGTQPVEMAEQIAQFIKQPQPSPLTAWWMPWLVNVGSLPFVLIFGAVVAEVLLVKFGLMKPGPPS